MHRLATALLLALPLPALAQGDAPDPHGLAGLNAVHVEFGTTQLVDNLRVHGLLDRIEDRLTARGLQILSGPDDGATLEMDVVTLQSSDGRIVGELTLTLYQDCLLERAPDAPVRAATWSESAVFMAVPLQDTVRGLIDANTDTMVSHLLREFAEAPDLPGAASEPEPGFLVRVWRFANPFD